jgi:outer membrane protein assembly factor BamB
MDYSIEESDLVVREANTGQLVWKGQPDNYPVETVLPIPDAEDCIVLLKYNSGPADGDFHNLLRCRPDGEVVWRANLPNPGTSDFYVTISWKDGVLVGYSWSGYLADIDPATGKIVSMLFTK